MKEEELKTLQTTILLLDEVPKMEIIRMDLAPYLKKAEEVVKVIVK